MAVAAAVGADRRRVRSDGADIRLTSLFVAALDGLGHSFGEPSGFALVATGGYGRRELAPASDLDVVLVHDGRSVAADPGSVAAVAERLWYPLWDDGVRLDHAVRTVSEARAAAASDLRTALSLLDARHIVGDPGLTLTLRTTLLADWRSAARTRLPELRTMAAERAAMFGDLAHTQAPDLKEARGGLRDLVLLDALVASWLVDVPHRRIDAARELLLDVRDALHAVTGRAADRLGPDDQPDVAAALGMADQTELLRTVSGAARTVALTSDVTWRRVAVLLRDRPTRRPAAGADVLRPEGPPLTPLAPGVAMYDEEVVLARGADPVADPTLVLRAAAAAARAELPVAPATLDRLAAVDPPPQPWPAPYREALIDLLGAGPGLVTVAELLDDYGILERWLPAWDLIRCLPSSSPVHRWTVDRHSLGAVVEATALVRRVSRPDLLLLAALLHDLGKGVTAGSAPGQPRSAGAGRPPDHCAAGAPVAATVARSIGLGEDDVATVAALVGLHLLLADTATRRDLDDPATLAEVVRVLRDASAEPAALLESLAALTEADARATGPVAWSPWRSGLVLRLVDEVRARLGGAPAGVGVPAQTRLRARLAELASLVRDSEPVVLLGAGAGTGMPASTSDEAAPAAGGVRASWELTILAPDRLGLLAVVAGVLTSDRFSLRSAVVATDGLTALVECVVARRPEDPPEPARIRQLLSRALAGRLDVAARLAAREADRTGANARAALPVVAVLAGASVTATVLEVRAADRPGLLYRVCSTISDAGGQLRSAHASTLGGDVVDVFYVVGSDDLPLGSDEADRLATLVRAALTGPAAAAPPEHSGRPSVAV